MRKLLSAILVLMLAAGVFAPAALHANEISVTIDGVAVNFEGQGPVIIEGRTLVPVRGVFETLGFEVTWDGDISSVFLVRDDFSIQIIIGDTVFIRHARNTPRLSGVSVIELDVPAQIIDGRTLLPIRAVVESMGYYVDWDGTTNTVVISSTPVARTIPDYITIRGVQYSTSLTELSITRPYRGAPGPENEDIAPLRYMVNLTRLSVGGGPRISDITPLSELTNLTDLGLWGVHDLSDITPLAGLTNLTRLTLTSGEISDITPLAGLTNLGQLRLEGNNISDLTPLAELTNLYWLILQYNPINDVTPLAGLVNLENLSVRSPQTWITPPEYWHIETSGRRISDITPLSGLANLRILDLGGSYVSDITPLAGLTNLEVLAINNSRISNIAPLANLTNLWSLSLNFNNISDLTPLTELDNLIWLNVAGNPITDWSPVEHVIGIDVWPLNIQN